MIIRTSTPHFSLVFHSGEESGMLKQIDFVKKGEVQLNGFNLRTSSRSVNILAIPRDARDGSMITFSYIL